MSTRRKVSLPPRTVDTGTKERAQHGALVAESDPNVAGLVRVRAIPLVDQMEKAGTITKQQLAAAHAFFWDYRDARVGPHYAQSNLLRVGGMPDPEISMKVVYARTRLRSIENLIGKESMFILQHVVGEDRSLDDTAILLRQAGFVPRQPAKVSGSLNAVLSMLVGYYRC